MSNASDDELLRLARKAFPTETPDTVEIDEYTCRVRASDGYALMHLPGSGERTIRAAVHAALLVLAGES